MSLAWISAAAAFYTQHSWVYYGIGVTYIPLLFAVCSGAALELLARADWCQKYLITYGRTARRDAVAQTRSKISFMTQVRGTLWSFFGPLSIISTAIFWLMLDWRTGGRTFFPLPSPAEFARDFVMSALIADFGLYWGHRVQHDSLFLWDRCHSLHHRLANPSAFSVAYIDQVDAALQSAIPVGLAALLLGAHPLTMLAYHAFHYSNNFLNHSGLDAWWLDLVTLKFVPGRSSNAFHDFHHHFSSRGKNRKNFAEMFWIWDWLFGTYCEVELLTTHNKPMKAKQGD